jgi:hypothetical protein
VALVVGDDAGGSKCSQLHLGTGDNRDVVPTSELEAMGDVTGSAATRVGGGGDADEFDARPAEQHSQSAGVVGVAPKVGVEMDPHQVSMPPVPPGSRSRRTSHADTG